MNQASEIEAAPAKPIPVPFLFSPVVDLLTFGGSALVALAMLPLGAALGILHDDTPGWTWIGAILLIDVAHVYATGFRVYFDLAELRRRPWLYGLTPLLAFAVGVAVYSEGELLFWSVLAYLAVFHFVRQQYGWIALYRSRENQLITQGPRPAEPDQQGPGITSPINRDTFDRIGWWVDASAIYLATLYPLVYWHASPPRHFHWFAEGDFFHLPPLAATLLEPIYWLALAAYAWRSLWRGLKANRWNPGKDLVVFTTAICWYVGIISLNSDYAFTVTNVIIHGVPYMVLIYWYRWHRQPRQSKGLDAGDTGAEPTPFVTTSRWHTTAGRVSLFFGAIWVLAYAEELLWDGGSGQRHEWLFAWCGTLPEWLETEAWLAPALAVPQITHYVLDGFIWRRSAR
ncbi:hypothetical protein SAMN06265222_105186 [Neorhodopirellula lusitana]|uniref:Uncharacterized protein n=1 Tax=Neorhodopirellula lusitana TaxID=445327 RepID=A0ABY1Q1T5_9BACT|nr:hypothetical protein [Neorhodopirellula lusitana]SMP56666.1 hypothetical protein SAMN06265222_105186 [Neorhodopirellula lusitana]